MKQFYKECRYKTMIQLEVNQANLDSLIKEIDNKLLGIEELTKPYVLEQISKAVFTITGERFVLAADSYARSNPKAMHHVYEWGKIGYPEGRLFVINMLSMLGGTLEIGSEFLPSSLPVPINPELQVPGPTGKTVTAQNIFRDKAEIMEGGTAVRFTAKRVLSFMGNNGIAFIAKGTPVNILNPGGSKVKNSFTRFMVDWYVANAGVIMDSSGFYERIVNDAAVALNVTGSNAEQVRAAVARAAEQASQGKEMIR